MRWVLALVALTACGRIGFTGEGGSAGNDAGDDDGSTTGPWGPWDPPMLIGAANSTSDDISPTFSSTGLELYISSTRGGASFDLWRSTRVDGGAFGTAVHETVAGATTVAEPTIAKEGLAMYIKTGVSPLAKITRMTTTSTWDAPVPVAALDGYRCSDLGGNDLRMVMSNVTDDALFEATRPDTSSDAWVVTRIAEIALGAYETCPCLSDDGLEMIFQSDSGSSGLSRSTRAALDGTWSPPEPVDLGGLTGAADCALARDGTEMAFEASNGANLTDIYLVTRERL